MKKYLFFISVTQMFFLYGIAQNVGIGTLNPTRPLTVLTTATAPIGIVQTDGLDSLGMFTGTTFGWLGTISNHPFRIGANNQNNHLTILQNGNVGIGTTTPSAKLEVAGQVKITGGIPGLNKVLTSDANGLATWQNSAGGNGSSAGFAAHRTISISQVQTFSGNDILDPVLFPIVEFNDANAYNATTSTYTAPSAGLYHFDVTITFGTAAANSTIAIELYTGGGTEYTETFPTNTSTYNHVSYSTNIKLAANESVQVLLTNLSNTAISTSLFTYDTRFSGYKVY